MKRLICCRVWVNTYCACSTDQFIEPTPNSPAFHEPLFWKLFPQGTPNIHLLPSAGWLYRQHIYQPRHYSRNIFFSFFGISKHPRKQPLFNILTLNASASCFILLESNYCWRHITSRQLPNRPWCYDSMDSSTTNRMMMMMMSASQKSSLKSLIFKLDTHQTLTKKSQPYTLRTSALLLSYKWKSSFFSFENVKCKISADKTWKKPGIFEVFLMLGLKNKRRTIFFP